MTTGLYKEEKTPQIQEENIFNSIRKWGNDRNFYGEGGATIQSQFVKLIEESGELAGNIARGKDLRDDIGDIVVVLTHIAKLSGLTIEECISYSFNEIKDRKGRFINGSFIKESDLKE